MDGLNELTTPIRQTIVLGGKTYQMEFLRVKDWGVIETEVARRRPDPLDIVLAMSSKCNAKHVERLVDTAYRDRFQASRATLEEVYDFLGTAAGMSWQVWLMARRENPDEIPEILTAIEALPIFEGRLLQAALNTINSPPVGNADGRQETGPRATESPSPGVPSSEG